MTLFERAPRLGQPIYPIRHDQLFELFLDPMFNRLFVRRPGEGPAYVGSAGGIDFFLHA